MNSAPYISPAFRGYRIYLLGLVLILLTLGLRLFLKYDQPVFTLFLIPVVIIAYLGGLGPGLAATAFTAAVTDYFIIEPVYSFGWMKPVNFAQWSTFILDGVIVSVLSEALHRSRARAELRAAAQAQLQEASQRQADLRALLLECSRMIMEAPNVSQELMERIFRKVNGPLRAELCAHYRLKDETLSLVAGTGIPEQYMDRARTLKRSESYCGVVATTLNPLVVKPAQIQTEPRGLILKAINIRAYFLHPLLDLNRKVHGTLSMGTTSRDEFTSEEIDFFQTLCQLVAVALQRTTAFDQLRESEARLRAALNAGGIGTWTADLERGWTHWDEALGNIYGRPCPTGGLLRSEFLNHVHPEDRTIVEKAALACVANQREYNIEFRYLRPDGVTIWVESRATIERDAQGRAIRVIGASVDITHRKRLEDQYRHAQKMEAVGQLAAGVAHDFNNLLTVISGYSELLMQRLPEKDPTRGPVNSIHTAGQRAASLTQQLLAFSRKQVLEPKVLDLNDIIVQTSRMLQRLIGEDIRLATLLAPGLSRVKVDPSQVEQVLMNLAVNARDAMPKGGLITMETSNVAWDEAYCQSRPDCKPGRYVALTVSDTGTGMTPEIKARIFEPFFTTKGVGKGTGLGLATVFGIVKQSDGYIDVVSEPEAGTSFKIYFPAVDAPVPTIDPSAMHQIPQRGSESVLVVEDEDDLRPLVKEVLEEFGYKVYLASCGSEALEMLEKISTPLDLLLTDVVLPEMSGHSIAVRTRQKFPLAKVLYMSGYIADDVLRHGIVAEKVEFIHKPFSPLALANRVREVLDSEVHSQKT